MLLPLICCGSWSWYVYLTDLLHVGWRSAGILYSFVFTILILFPHSLEGNTAKLVQFHPSESTSQKMMFSSVLSFLFSESSRETEWHSLVYARPESLRACYFFMGCCLLSPSLLCMREMLEWRQKNKSPLLHRLHANWKEQTSSFCILSYRADGCYFFPWSHLA